MYRSTVDFARSMPIFLSSPAIRGAPQSGFAGEIRRIKSRASFGTEGLPGFPERDSLVQYPRNFLLRHAMTVSGRTITRASRQPAQTRESHDQRIRSPAEDVDEDKFDERRQAGGAGRGSRVGEMLGVERSQ